MLLSLKEKYLSERIKELKDSIKTLSDDDIYAVQKKLVDLERSKIRVNKLLGRVVTK